MLSIELRERLRGAARPTLLLDYDGTLVPLAPHPDLAAPDGELLALLARLAERCRVHLVSGRPRADLERWMGALPVGLHAEHGLWSRPSPDAPWAALDVGDDGWKGRIRVLLAPIAERAAGAFLEEKTFGLAFHHRACGRADADAALRAIDASVAPELGALDLEILRGSAVVEVRPRGAHKGRVVPAILAGAAPDALVLAAGDDATDEDLFAALPPDAITIHVGGGASRARFRLPDPAALRALLADLKAP